MNGSATTLKPQTDDMNNTDHVVTLNVLQENLDEWLSCGCHLKCTTHPNTIAGQAKPPKWQQHSLTAVTSPGMTVRHIT